MRDPFKTFSVAIVIMCMFIPGITDAMPGVDSLWREANVKMESGLPHEALSDLFIILELADDSPQTVPDSILASTLLLTGNIYLGFNDFVNSSRYYERTIKATGNPDIKLKAIYNLSVNYALLGEEQKALGTNACIRQLDVADTLLRQYDQIISMAFIEKAFGHAEQSAPLFHRGLAIANSMGPRGRSYRLTPFSELAEYYEKQGEQDSALIYFHRYEDLALQLKVPQMIADSQRGLMRMYIKSGDRQKALDYSNRYMATMDSMVDMTKFIRISADRERRRESADNERIQNLQFTVSKQKAVLYAISAILVITLAIVLFARTLRGRTRQLFARNREIAMLQNSQIQSNEYNNMPNEPEHLALDQPSPHEGTDQHGLMDRIIQEISKPDNFCDPSYSIATLAQSLGVNSHYVSDAINTSTGDNFRALLNRYRIDEGRRRLTSDPAYQSLTIKSIGESVGFKSPSNFVIAFRKITGMTPSLYQKMAKEENKNNP